MMHYFDIFQINPSHLDRLLLADDGAGDRRSCCRLDLHLQWFLQASLVGPHPDVVHVAVVLVEHLVLVSAHDWLVVRSTGVSKKNCALLGNQTLGTSYSETTNLSTPCCRSLRSNRSIVSEYEVPKVWFPKSAQFFLDTL